MKTIDWIEDEHLKGELCEEYYERLCDAKSKKQVMDIVMDINGLEYLCLSREKGNPLPYEVIEKEFRSYINGKYIPKFNFSKMTEYDSSVYLSLGKDCEVNVGTTLALFLNCSCDIYVKDYHVARIFLDGNCDVRLHCPKGASVIVEAFGDAKVEYEGYAHIRIRRRRTK